MNAEQRAAMGEEIFQQTLKSVNKSTAIDFIKNLDWELYKVNQYNGSREAIEQIRKKRDIFLKEIDK